MAYQVVVAGAQADSAEVEDGCRQTKNQSKERGIKMKWCKVKEDAAVKWGDLGIDVERVDGSMKGVTFYQGEAPVLRAQLAGWNDFEVLIPSPPVKVKKYRLTGKYLGIIPVNEIFTEKSDADLRLEEVKKSTDAEETGLIIEEYEEAE